MGATNAKGGFVPPLAEKLVWECPACKGFNSTKVPKCKKCGAEKPQK
jgi:lipopolysaccharide biosynthesis regulator YciM